MTVQLQVDATLQTPVMYEKQVKPAALEMKMHHLLQLVKNIIRYWKIWVLIVPEFSDDGVLLLFTGAKIFDM